MSDARKLDPIGGIAIVVGSILGSGIFIAPAMIASFSESIWISCGFWIIGGMVCMAGATIYGGLGLMYPQTGGQYIYLRETLGSRYAKLYGWSSLLIICPTMLASLALFFAVLCRDVLPGAADYAKLTACSLLIFFTLLNTWGLEISGWIQKILVVIHVILFIGVAVLAVIFLPNAEFSAYINAPILKGPFSIDRAILAAAAVLWSFEGFNSITFLTNEVQNGERNVRRIALGGCIITLVLYLAFNLVALANVPVGEISKQTNVAGYLMGALYGAGASWTVFFLVGLGIATGIHAAIVIGPRVIIATVRDAGILRWLMKLDRKTGTPKLALWFQCGLSCVFVLIGHFDSLMTAFIVVNWLFHGLIAVGYLRVRRNVRRAGSQVIGESLCAILFLAMVLLLVASQVSANPWLSVIGLTVFAIGLYWPRRAAEV